MTAGNSTPLTDGASTVLLASDEWADARDLPKLAAVVDAEAAAVDFVHGKDGLLMAPVFAVPRLLARHNLTLADIDYFEIHEAFAATVLSTLAASEDEEFGRTRLGLDGALGKVRPLTFERQRLVAGRRTPVCGHRRTHRGVAGQVAARQGQHGRAAGPRTGVGVRCRRPGRRRNPGIGVGGGHGRQIHATGQPGAR